MSILRWIKKLFLDNPKGVDKLAKGTDATHKGGDGKTPLMSAVENDNKEAVDSLVKSGADVNARDAHGKTALMYAIENDNEDMIDLLIENNSDVSVIDGAGKNNIDVCR